MSSTYKEYLAASVINDGNIISYRTLSRALKVHSNIAKKMLYDFHKTQNARKKGSIHACYLVSGVQNPTSSEALDINGSNAGHDLDSSFGPVDSFMSSSMPEPKAIEESEPVKTVSIVLVAEEKLEDVKQSFESISSIHIYSVEPGTLGNIQVLSDCNRKIAFEYANDDLMQTWKHYGTIHNPDAKRRELRRPPPAPAPVVTSTMKSNSQQEIKKSSTETKSGSSNSAAVPKGTSRPPASVKSGSSSLLQSFAKAKTKQEEKKQVKSNDDMKIESDLEEDEDMDEEMLAIEDSAEAKAKADANRKARSEREETLRKMMEEDDDDNLDEEMSDAAPEPAPVGVPEDDNDNEAERGHEDGVDSPITTEKAEVAAKKTGGTSNVTVSNGRRRGRRLIMKKKTTQDAEGYLVTKEEPGWESFSEDEVPPPAPKQAFQSQPKKCTASSGATTAKKGQGNIMSFFQKK